MSADMHAKDSIEERLRNERPVHSAPEGFTDRVMANLSDSRPVREEEVETRGALWPRFALRLALITIATVLAFQFLKGPVVEPQIALNGAHEPAADPEQVPSVAVEPLTFPVPRITSEQLQALTTRLDQPLEKELENVISDTRQAIQFVASNFLPEK
ncbi:MAG: hypothetical protein ACXW32_06810 [Limisphaerales bacterium]